MKLKNEINEKIVSEILGLKVYESFSCQSIGLVNAIQPNTLSFIDDKRFLSELIENSNITVVLTSSEYVTKINNKTCIVTDDPRYDFYFLYNQLTKNIKSKNKNIIHKSATIHTSAQIADYNVMIGEDCLIEPNVTILSDVIIGNKSIIRSGAVIGTEGFEQKSTSKGVLSVKHLGNVIIESNVEIGANTCIDKALMGSTIIQEGTKIDNLCHIAHNVNIGKNCIITAGVVIAGSCDIGDSVFFGVSSSVRPKIVIGNKAFIGMGSVVVRNVNQETRIFGNPAKEQPI